MTDIVELLRRLDMSIGNKSADEIERLRAEVATEKTKHHYTALAAHAEAQEVNQLNAELAASQAHIEKLRGVLAYAARCLDTDGNDPVIDAPLTLPHDNTALKERLRQERERCAKYFEDRAERYLQDYAFGADMNYRADLLGYAEAIRNLGDE